MNVREHVLLSYNFVFFMYVVSTENGSWAPWIENSPLYPPLGEDFVEKWVVDKKQ